MPSVTGLIDRPHIALLAPCTRDARETILPGLMVMVQWAGDRGPGNFPIIEGPEEIAAAIKRFAV